MADGQLLLPASYNLVLAELYAPNILEMDTVEKTIRVFEGMDNFIICEVFSIPHATISWTLDNNEITEGVTQVCGCVSAL